MKRPPRKQPKAISPRRRAILQTINDDENVIFLEGPQFDAAIVGLLESYGRPRVVCYDCEKVLAVLRKQMSDDDAIEWYEVNIIGAYMGDETPAYLQKLEGPNGKS